eukprot:TRINITY_DN10757_c0_g2_i2.p1 TRINITY_DN10757_c0_g2~~TRINITY_DN10757_c0_g2_i2.p1  ORF type:complete len:763 (+),score=148.49 TRINITY_DN10757_c0_g2_i2:115-2403(+)
MAQSLLLLWLVSGVASGIYPWYDARLQYSERVAMLVGNMTVAELIPQMIKEAPAIPRLGLPRYSYWCEAAHGIAGAGRATVFPASIGRAAAFDVDLEEAAARVVAQEGAAKYNDYLARNNGSIDDGFAITYYAPVINIARSPSWGRTQESYGESVHLSKVLGARFVQGIQVTSEPVLPYNQRYQMGSAMAKHFMAYDIESALINGTFIDQYRLQFDAVVGQADLYQTYLPAFASLVDAGVSTAMCSYNAVNGTPMCASPLLKSLLRDQMGFEGALWSDGGAVGFIQSQHHYTKDLAEAAADSLNAGVDLNSGGKNSNFGYLHLNESLARGLVSETQLRTAVSRLMLLRMKLGMFDPPELVPNRQLSVSATVDTPEHRALARQYAVESIVLLKNDNGLLPLCSSQGAKIAVVGPNANSSSVLLSNYAGCREPFGGPITTDCRLVTVLEGLSSNTTNTILYAPGSHLNVSNSQMLMQAQEVAKESSVVVAVLGLQTTNAEKLAVFEGEAHDRFDLGLSASQSELLEVMCQQTAPVVMVLLNGGSMMLTPSQVACASAIVEAFYPGEEGGNAVADIVYGRVSPSGRLPYTMYREGALRADHLDMDMKSDPGQTFRYYGGQPAFGFGFGLTYSNITYSKLALDLAVVSLDTTIRLQVDVTNTGQTYSVDEVVQVYVGYANRGDAASCQSIPMYELKAFARVKALAPGETRTVKQAVNVSELKLMGRDCKMGVMPGYYNVWVGGHSPSIGRYQPASTLLQSSFLVVD